jgi:hypothetical protein
MRVRVIGLGFGLALDFDLGGLTISTEGDNYRSDTIIVHVNILGIAWESFR